MPSTVCFPRFVCPLPSDLVSTRAQNTVMDEFGADSLRLYIMFMGPVDAVKPWDTSRVSGVHRFLSRVWRLYERHHEPQPGPGADELVTGHLLKSFIGRF